MKIKAGFTLIELLVVIAIIGILAAMLVPKIQRAKAEVDRKNSPSQKSSSTIPSKRFVISEREYLGNNRGVDVVSDLKTGKEYLLFYTSGSVSACLRSEPEVELPENQ